MLGKLAPCVNHSNVASCGESFVVVQLTERKRICDFHSAKRKSRRTSPTGSPGDQCPQTHAHVAGPHLGEHSRRSTSTRYVGSLRLACIKVRKLARQIAVHQQSIPGQIEMTVDNKLHGA